MRIKNLLHFTENHRYCVYREFGIGALDERMLSLVYQPLTGAFAISVYRLLCEHVEAQQVGYSPIEQQRRLFLTLGLEPGEHGRKFLVEQTSLLEAVGLLQTNRVYFPDQDDYIYEYELQQPLSPSEFFRTQHLTLLLRDKMGKFAVLSLRERFLAKEPDGWGDNTVQKENISQPFYDIFELNTHVIDYELEQALTEVSAQQRSSQPKLSEDDLINYADIIRYFPRGSRNRIYVEKLRFLPEQMNVLSYIAYKYRLDIQDICRMLDEDGVFDAKGELAEEEIQRRANLQFRQGKKRQEERQIHEAKVISLREEKKEESQDLPVEYAVEMEYYLEVPRQFTSKCDIHQYNTILRNEPYTRVLEMFYPGSVPNSVNDIFEHVDINYKLSEEVVNVLIHYLLAIKMSQPGERLSSKFVDWVVTNMLNQQVDTYEKAVRYVREQNKLDLKISDQAKLQAKGGATGGNKRTNTRTYNRSANAKPEIPIVKSAREGSSIVSDEEIAEAMRLAEQMQSGQDRVQKTNS
ncbi:helicase DnaB [Paenibacillus kyungheensis]|uniref:Helicase DnaB n=1 Tax=Paenibacillus kyungheensis TaxID=1452732 RepID=A0AAX3LYX9_9BACL|nr:helicase DnaB [Paenibacillus kyungheensis]WCT55030.1 helicase DnaB [Paenibacillus kyungheensis]